MKLAIAFLGGATLLMSPGLAQGSDAGIRQRIIEQSIAGYSGNCPCPYNRASNGSRCGKRSAWNRAGGYSPKCVDSDLSDADVRAFRQRNGR